MTFEPAHNVVIDAANFLRDNSKKFVPKKLENSVFSFIQKRGGRPIAILAAGTYGAIIKEQSTNGCDDWTDFTEKLDAGQIRVVEGNDDLYMIQHSLNYKCLSFPENRNIWRSEHPEIDWESLSKLQISNYESTENRFFSEQLHEFLKSLLLRFTNIVFNSCSNSANRCDKSVIMEEMGKEFVSRIPIPMR